MAVPFFVLGFKMQWLNKIDRFSPHIRIIYILFFLILSVLINAYNGRVDIDLVSFGRNICLFYLCGVCGSLALMLLCTFLSGWINKFVKIVASGTIVILGLNLYAISYFKIIAGIIGLELLPNVRILISMSVMCVLYPVILLIQRYWPIAIGKRKSK